VGQAYCELFKPRAEPEAAIVWADTFRDYVSGRSSPRSATLWRFAAAARAADTRNVWCAGPLALFACSRFTDCVRILAIWRLETGRDIAEFVGTIGAALAHLPSDDEPDLVALFESSRAELLDPVTKDAIQAYVADGDISDFASAKRQYERRRRARQTWTLDEGTSRELDNAWERAQSDPVDELWSDETLGIALAVAEAPLLPLPQKSTTVLSMLARWARSATPTRLTASMNGDSRAQRLA
jgi:hypothetical protein